jgi:general secretion pathway protein G
MYDRVLLVRVRLLVSCCAVALIAVIFGGCSSSERVNSKEALLRQDLFEIRQRISQYTDDKKRAPQSLNDLISAGYLKQIPIDPITRAANWTIEWEDSLAAVDQQEPGIVDVHSSSNQTASDGTAYSSW